VHDSVKQQNGVDVIVQRELSRCKKIHHPRFNSVIPAKPVPSLNREPESITPATFRLQVLADKYFQDF
jgi:hypothetical protein